VTILKLWSFGRIQRSFLFQKNFEVILNYLKRNPKMSSIAKDEDTIIGAVLCGHDGRKGSFYHLAVSNKYRVQGIAKRMLKRSKEELRKNCIDACFLFVHCENKEAINFWKKDGWKHAEMIGYYYKEI
jgi:ribosomal protein S18 acetylase RimI-like enzyme